MSTKSKKIVVIGGTGLIGRKLVPLLEAVGHQVLAASPSRGVDSVTGAGLASALEGADVVVDVTNSPSFEDSAVLRFFETSTRNLLAAAVSSGVGHYIALSVVGADRVPDSGYLRAKIAQESLIRAGGVPYTILRATQFFEFLKPIAESCVEGSVIRLSAGAMQPLAADDVAAALARRVAAGPVNGIVDVAGPERGTMASFVSRVLDGDARTIVTDPAARYFGALIDDTSLVPTGAAELGSTTLNQWMMSAGVPLGQREGDVFAA